MRGKCGSTNSLSYGIRNLSLSYFSERITENIFLFAIIFQNIKSVLFIENRGELFIQTYRGELLSKSSN